MKTRFIINPISGTGKQKGINKHIAKHFKNYDIVETKKPGDAKKLSLEAVNNQYQTIIAVGGDGTVNECLESVINTKTALGVIPCGSGNGFALHIGMLSSPKEALKQLKKKNIKIIDTCTINKIPFVNVSGIGFDAHIANLFSKLNKRGFINYMKLIIKELSYQPKEYVLEYNNQSQKTSAYMIAFANASQYGNNACISPLSKITDGLVDIIIVKKFAKWRIPLFIMKLFKGNLHLSKYVQTIKCEKIKIITKEKLIHIDGEPLQVDQPIVINASPKTLKILTPNE